MEEYAKIIISILSLVAAILGVVKAYIEFRKKNKLKKELNMKNNNSNNAGNLNSISTVTGNIVINSNGTTSSQEPKTEQSCEKNREIKLNDNYTSLFAEDDKLKSEQIAITSQKNGVIKGIVTLIENDQSTHSETRHEYILEGRYRNKILTAEYFSQSESVDERGSINLKLIDSDILSGFCSFSKVATTDDEIRVSPYVWVSGKNQNLLDGTFEFCHACHEEHRGCCCASEKVDMPVFLTCRNSKEIVAINVSMLNVFENDTVVDIDALKNVGLISNPRDGVKILGEGDLERKLTVKVNYFSKTAQEKIEAAGGKAEVI